MRRRKSLGVPPHVDGAPFLSSRGGPELVPEIGLKRRRVTFTKTSTRPGSRRQSRVTVCAR